MLFAYLGDYSKVQAELLYVPGNQEIHLTHFIVIFPLLRWSAALRAISLSHALSERFVGDTVCRL